MAYDLWSKEQTGRDWSIGDWQGQPVQPGQPQPRRWRRRRRHHHHRQLTPAQQQQWGGSPPGAPPAAAPPYNPYGGYQQPATPQPGVPQPTIDVFVGRALMAGASVQSVQKALVRKGYDPRQISANVRGAYKRTVGKR